MHALRDLRTGESIELREQKRCAHGRLQRIEHLVDLDEGLEEDLPTLGRWHLRFRERGECFAPRQLELAATPVLHHQSVRDRREKGLRLARLNRLWPQQQTHE